MCFGGSKSTNNTNSPAYAPTPEAGATAVQKDSVKSPPKGEAPGLSDRPTQADYTGSIRPDVTGLNLR